MKALVAATVAMLVAAAVVLVAAGDSTAGKGVALTLFGIACVVAVSLVFLAVGRSEDAERAAAAAARERPPEAQPDPHAGEAARRSRARPPRRPS